MDRGRRVAGGMAMTLGALCAGVLGGAPVARSASCVVLCSPTTTTTASPPTTTVAPTFTAPVVSNVTATSATVNASVTPGSQGVLYTLGVDGSFTAAGPGSVTGEFPAGSTPMTVTKTLTDLEPNSRFTVQWSGDPLSSGDFESVPISAPITAFTTPILPPAALQVTSRNELKPYSELHDATFTGTVTGVLTPSPLVTLQVSVEPYRHGFREYQPPMHDESNQQFVTHGRFSFAPSLNRNARLRVYIPGDSGPGSHHIRQPSVSKYTQVYVEPTLSGSTSRPDPYSATSLETADLDVHPVSPHWRGEDVYFYYAYHPKGPYHLVGRAPLRPTGFEQYGSETIRASLRFNEPRAGYGAQCIRHRVLVDMGLPFTDPGCGGRVLG